MCMYPQDAKGWQPLHTKEWKLTNSFGSSTNSSSERSLPSSLHGWCPPGVAPAPCPDSLRSPGAPRSRWGRPGSGGRRGRSRSAPRSPAAPRMGPCSVEYTYQNNVVHHILITPHQDNSPLYRYWSWWVFYWLVVVLVGSCPSWQLS